MVKHTGFLLAFFMLAQGAVASDAKRPYPCSNHIEFALQAQKLIYNDQFTSADSLSNHHILDNPDDPIGYFFKATGMLSEMTDAEANLYDDEFTTILDLIEQKSDRIIESADSTTIAWMYLFKGSARAYRSLHESRFGSFISAVKHGMGARSQFVEGLKFDSTVYDLYLGLGSYHYWKSAKAGFLKYLLIFKNEKQKGIDEVLLAADSSLLFTDAARSALLWIWLNERKYDSVIATAEPIREIYPHGKSILWPLAEAYFESRSYRKTIEIYEELRRRLSLSPGNYFNIVECDYRICVCYEKMRLNNEASETARRLNQYRDSLPKNTRNKQQSNLEYLILMGKL